MNIFWKRGGATFDFPALRVLLGAFFKPTGDFLHLPDVVFFIHHLGFSVPVLEHLFVVGLNLQPPAPPCLIGSFLQFVVLV